MALLGPLSELTQIIQWFVLFDVRGRECGSAMDEDGAFEAMLAQARGAPATAARVGPRVTAPHVATTRPGDSQHPPRGKVEADRGGALRSVSVEQGGGADDEGDARLLALLKRMQAAAATDGRARARSSDVDEALSILSADDPASLFSGVQVTTEAENTNPAQPKSATCNAASLATALVEAVEGEQLTASCNVLYALFAAVPSHRARLSLIPALAALGSERCWPPSAASSAAEPSATDVDTRGAIVRCVVGASTVVFQAYHAAVTADDSGGVPVASPDLRSLSQSVFGVLNKLLAAVAAADPSSTTAATTIEVACALLKLEPFASCHLSLMNTVWKYLSRLFVPLATLRNTSSALTAASQQTRATSLLEMVAEAILAQIEVAVIPLLPGIRIGDKPVSVHQFCCSIPELSACGWNNGTCTNAQSIEKAVKVLRFMTIQLTSLVRSESACLLPHMDRFVSSAAGIIGVAALPVSLEPTAVQQGLLKYVTPGLEKLLVFLLAAPAVNTSTRRCVLAAMANVVGTCGRTGHALGALLSWIRMWEQEVELPPAAVVDLLHSIHTLGGWLLDCHDWLIMSHEADAISPGEQRPASRLLQRVSRAVSSAVARSTRTAQFAAVECWMFAVATAGNAVLEEVSVCCFTAVAQVAPSALAVHTVSLLCEAILQAESRQVGAALARVLGRIFPFLDQPSLDAVAASLPESADKAFASEGSCHAIANFIRNIPISSFNYCSTPESSSVSLVAARCADLANQCCRILAVCASGDLLVEPVISALQVLTGLLSPAMSRNEDERVLRRAVGHHVLRDCVAQVVGACTLLFGRATAELASVSPTEVAPPLPALNRCPIETRQELCEAACDVLSVIPDLMSEEQVGLVFELLVSLLSSGGDARHAAAPCVMGLLGNLGAARVTSPEAKRRAAGLAGWAFRNAFADRSWCAFSEVLQAYQAFARASTLPGLQDFVPIEARPPLFAWLKGTFHTRARPDSGSGPAQQTVGMDAFGWAATEKTVVAAQARAKMAFGSDAAAAGQVGSAPAVEYAIASLRSAALVVQPVLASSATSAAAREGWLWRELCGARDAIDAAAGAEAPGTSTAAGARDEM